MKLILDYLTYNFAISLVFIEKCHYFIGNVSYDS